MFKFNFSRAEILDRIATFNKYGVSLLYPQVGKELEIKTKNIRYVRSPNARSIQEDNGMKITFIDRGPRGDDTKHVVIAGASSDTMSEFFEKHTNVEFPGFTKLKSAKRNTPKIRGPLGPHC